MPSTVRTDAVEQILAIAERAGLDRAALLARARIPGDVLRGGGGRIAVERLHALWHAVTRDAGRALTSKVAAHARVEGFGPYGFSILTAPTALDALRTATEHYPVINDDGRWSVELGASRVVARWARAGAATAGVDAASESIVAHFVLGLRSIVDGPIRVDEVRFAHAAPRGVRALEEVLRAPLVFDAGENAIVLPRADLDAVPRLASAPMHAFVTGFVRDELARIAPERTFVDHVADALAARPDARASRIAAELGVTERTLRRRLADTGTSFRALVDARRAAIALDRVEHTDDAITRIAIELGFTDASAFARAFRRWHGRSPSKVRDAR
ncbi:AraC family transcriptional regulator [Sandaracinus amylolyticus]|uniref:Transcriptional regulator, AraC family protein n=1 Tax=Sandaracinus amylolyticus TaxID=927083 RepID=A0A0F6YJ02_9BACT|nr:AraC family transcriptional regulator [Sandaracinus amylolyticus]AKF06763.1 Transcriptional regulator, AraC family protein [Sandaracinus amylolyticus]